MNWTEISSLATGAGTLVLAVATFASVRSANRSARIAEVALQEQRRPVLAPSRLEDPLQKIMFVESQWFSVQGNRGVAEYSDGNIYLVLSLRNVGSGIGVCQAWGVRAGQLSNRAAPQHLPEESLRAQTRDLYIPGGDFGIWQGAIRDPDDPDYGPVAEAIQNRQPVTIELLYSDATGGQRTVSRFGIQPWPDDTWFAQSVRHWFLDGPSPRDESAALARTEQILREQAVRAEHALDEIAHPAPSGDGDYSSSSES